MARNYGGFMEVKCRYWRESFSTNVPDAIACWDLPTYNEK